MRADVLVIDPAFVFDVHEERKQEQFVAVERQFKRRKRCVVDPIRRGSKARASWFAQHAEMFGSGTNP